MIMKFGEYLPDQPDFMNFGVTIAKNVIPGTASYEQFLGPSVYSNALSNRCQGAYSTKNSTGITNNFAGDQSKLYLCSSASYSDVSKVGGYTTSGEENWHFTQFGERVIATNFADNPQSYIMGSSTVFADLTTALKARYCATIRNFLVFGNTYDGSDGNVPHRIRWSALNDPTDFTISPVTQSDYQDLNSTYGWIRQVVGGEYGTIFQERAISRMIYVGSPAVFQFDEVEVGKGTQCPYSVVKIGNLIFYLGIDGFYIFDGNQSTPIGEGKINKAFFDDFDTAYYSRVYATADYQRQVVYVAYPGSGNTNGRANKILCYNYAPNAVNRWSFCEGVDLEFIYSALSEGYTLDSLDSLSISLDALTISLDSRVYMGSAQLFGGFDSNHKQFNFTGTALTALIQTPEVQINPGKRSNIFRARPLIDGSGTVTLELGTRNNLTEDVTWTPVLSLDQIGEFQMRSNARYHRARVSVSGGFNHAQGIELLEYSSGGKR